jgi:lipid A 3-O-deacylase
MRLSYRGWFTVFVLLLIRLSPARADGEPPQSGGLWRIEVDNDVLSSSDDNFSAGWNIQRHWSGGSSWGEPGTFSRWLADTVPGLEDGDGVAIRRGIGIQQTIQTPKNLAATAVIEGDVPYAGVLAVPNSWYALNDDHMTGLQLLVGVVGPASLGEDFQRCTHKNLGWGDEPQGWDNQLENEPLLNVNYTRIDKLIRTGVSPDVEADLSSGLGLGAGNLFTAASAQVQGRAGRALPLGFTPLPDMPGRGVISDATLDPPTDRISAYLTLTGRFTEIGYTVLLDGNTFEDTHQVEYEHSVVEAIFGAHVAYSSFAIHFSYYLATYPNDQQLSWANVSLDYRF